jgi:hypothetical protein
VSRSGHAPALDRLAAELREQVALLGADGLSTERLRVLLGRAELRVWRVTEVAPGGMVTVECPLGAGPASLSLARCPRGEPVAGAFLAGRSMPVGPRRWVLLGRAGVVAPEAAAAFERLLRSLRAPRGEFWRVHGGVLAQAARAA